MYTDSKRDVSNSVRLPAFPLIFTWQAIYNRNESQSIGKKFEETIISRDLKLHYKIIIFRHITNQLSYNVLQIYHHVRAVKTKISAS